VKFSYDAWLVNPLAEWKAKVATSNVDTTAGRLFVFWNKKDQSQVAGAKTAR
jgi:hypothetical protein